MPETELIPFDGGVPVPAPLSVRYQKWAGGAVLSVIVDGPLGSVELQIRPALLALPGGGMSVEYHSRQPMPGADTLISDCWVLDGDCYADGGSGGVQAEFEPMLRASDAEAIVTELARRYRVTTWTCDGQDEEQRDALARPGAGEIPAAGAEMESWD